MSDAATGDVDSTDAERREIGRGTFEEGMGPSSAMAHLYRGEIHRMTFWRERLDQTTNWAVITMTAVLTWAFSSPNNPHYILLIGAVTLSVFLVIEARRFRGYGIWRSRVRALQENVWAYGLDPSAGVVDPDWRRSLGRDYRTPAPAIGAEEAIAHRLRRVYLLLLGVVLVAWVARITAFSSEPWTASAAIGAIPGPVVTGAVGLFYLGALVVGFRPRTWQAEEELRE